MLARAPEQNIRWVRTGLLAAWFVLIASLFYDPLTPWLTAPDNSLSPFHVGGPAVVVQKELLPVAPYAMGNRIFWTMLLPLIPMVLLLLGHETWRRICPLSHFSQIPRMLGWQRQLRQLNRTSGRVERVLALLPSQSWLARNHLYVQFGFLTLGVIGRLLFYNASRPGLAAIFAFVLVSALAVGLLYGGKTWCNYFCPIAVIQDIYTGPGGLLDSKPHIDPSPIGQSTCRAPAAGADQSTCVGCTANCPDVDVENAYWRGLEAEPKRFMYYGFFGVVFAFYTYYYLYSGGWDYYMTGAWTHEPDQLATVLAPGLFIAGTAIAIPKLIAVPLYFAVCIAISYALFAGAERAYLRLIGWRGTCVSKARLRHQMLSVCAFLTFNLFYVFAGRPNILLMPPWAIRLVDIFIVAVSMAWLIRALRRDADIYRREHLAQSLRRQLLRMGFRSEAVLEGRPIEQLTAEEIYVLAKTLPNFTIAQKRDAYRAVLVEAVRSGRTRSADALSTLGDLRSQLGLSQADHHAIVEAIGIHDPDALDPNVARTVEQHIRDQNYRDFLLHLAPRPPAAAHSAFLASGEARSAAEDARLLFGISEADHARIVAEVAREESDAGTRAGRLLEALRDLETARFALLLDLRPETILLRHGLLQRMRRLLPQIVATIAELDDDRRARQCAKWVRMLIGKGALAALEEAISQAPAPGRAAFAVPNCEPPLCSYLDVIEHAPPPEEAVAALARDRDPVMAALAASLRASSVPAMAAAAPDFARREMSALPDLAHGLRRAALRGERLPEVELMADLAEVSVFGGLDLEALADIAHRSRKLAFAAGDLVCRLGDPSDAMFVLLTGKTEVWVERSGRRVPLGHGSPGAVFGELGLITGRPRSASVSVASAAATVLSVPREVVDGLLARDLQASRSVLSVVSSYLLDTLATGENLAATMPAAAD